MNASELKPYSFRLPANGETDPWFGGTRTFWAERIRPRLSTAPEVHSFAVQQPGAKRGIRFIDYESARAFMEKHSRAAALAAPRPTGEKQFLELAAA